MTAIELVLLRFSDGTYFAVTGWLLLAILVPVVVYLLIVIITETF